MAITIFKDFPALEIQTEIQVLFQIFQDRANPALRITFDQNVCLDLLRNKPSF